MIKYVVYFNVLYAYSLLFNILFNIFNVLNIIDSRHISNIISQNFVF